MSKSREKKTQAKISKAGKPPASPEAEVALLGSIFFEPNVVTHVIDYVSGDDFYVPANQAVARVIFDFYDANKAIDITVVYDELVRRKQDSLVGGHEGLMRVADAVPEASHAVHYAKIISKKAQLRTLIAACHEVISIAYDASVETEELLSKSEVIMNKALQRRTIKSAVSLAVQSKEELKLITEKKERTIGIETGYLRLDSLMSGIHPGEMTIIAARPSMGKTSLALNIMYNIAVEQQRPALYFALETTAEQTTRNLMAIGGEVSIQKMRSRMLTDVELTKLAITVSDFDKATVFIDHETDKMSELRAVSRSLHMKHNLSLIVVDYLQLLAHEIKYRREEVEQISRSLKRLAGELQVPLIAISQLSRQVEGRGHKISQKTASKFFRAGETVYLPRLSDLRESGAIEQDADNVLLLYRQDYYRYDKSTHDNVAHLRIAKQRFGSTDKVLLTFRPEMLRFENYIDEDEDSCAELREEQEDFENDLPF